MTINMTKLLKHVDGDIWRRFRAYCIANDINMGPAISALMIGVLMGKVTLENSNGVAVKSKSGSWQWPNDRKAGTP